MIKLTLNAPSTRKNDTSDLLKLSFFNCTKPLVAKINRKIDDKTIIPH